MVRQGSVSAAATFWGKAQPQDPTKPGMHPLPAHSLDVAAVALLLPRRVMAGLTTPTLGFFVALHDIGKFSRSFQAMAPEHWPNSVLGPLPASRPSGARHDALGLHLMRDSLEEDLADLLPAPLGWKHSDKAHIWRALAGHHGRPAAEGADPGPATLCRDCIGAARDFVADLRNIFHPAAWTRPALPDLVACSWRLAGLVTLADWIGSRQAWFPYVGAAALANPAGYFWDHALPRAAAALSAAGLSPAAPASFAGLQGLFPGVTLPSPLQRWAETVELPAGPVLAVIEDLTGSGKTEAALTLAHRLMAQGRAGGLYMALPTMATANAMFGRLAVSYRGLFAAEARPSLALAHGHAALDPRFAASLAPGPPPARTFGTEDQAEAQCAAWLADDRRRALLAQVGVGTLDQALLAALPVRHAPLRLQGLADKVLVVDEAHAFDPYMRTELAALLRFQAALGGSVVLLSATLPRVQRQALVNAFRAGLGAAPAALVETAYPLATLAAAAGTTETPCAVRDGLARSLAVTRLDDAAAALVRIVAAARAGAAVAWVRNTVDDAIAAARALREQGLEPLLFHARFAMADRLAIEAKVLRCFGRDSHRPMREAVLVATQVVEQSLDLDFDLLVSDLAPVDLLIQRAGRLWRHQRPEDERPLPSPEFLVVSPAPVEAPAADWIAGPQPGTAAVYRDPALLWRGARALFGRGMLTTPGDMRPLIEEAADANAPGALPPALAAAAGRAYGIALGHTEIARQNTLEVGKGYAAGQGAWDSDIRTPTRLEERPRVTLRLALLQDGMVVPYAQDADIARAWALSEVGVLRHRIGTCPPPAGLEAAVAAARSRWERWEREAEDLLLAVLTPAGDGFGVAVQPETGKAAMLHYDPQHGLQWAASAKAG
ncbi:CRISPR-associated helicase Cas3' [Roseomonas marmotae]|uniref:CRISPR-associated helicase Cas3 n=2 Tax=Roseomonas marmotae TaxID=2768161 RepID=A0ABS3KHJ5_9PROT|nr:CRISPR-associated helicase Cas3' [Roseomonas marmotae]MBO1076948.1 CRISPR-associated helicase Cas3' [Roseomonas marmotae]QTI82064.1 CRISPR-associated helicase Cas3' [Roseomonas marmotae]